VPKLNFEIPHTLSAEDAKSRLERFADSIKDKFQDQAKDIEQSWNGNALSFGFKTMGMKIEGNIEVDDQRLVVDSTIPFAAMMFKGKIESAMKEQLGRLVG